jgi:hypothetical protein
MSIKTRKISIPMQTRIANVQPKTIDEENRTVEVVFTTGSKGKRGGFFTEPFIEELGLKKSEVRMGRLNNKAPFLDSHGYGEKRGVRNVLGVVESAELVDGKEGRARIRFSKRADVDEVFQDVRDGILSHVSVGYNVHRFKEVGEEDGLPILRAVDWEPVEISLVSAGFDDKAVVRSKDEATNECELERIEKEVEPEIENKEEKEIVAENKNLRETQSTGDTNMDPIEKEKQEKERKEAELKLRNEALAEATAAEKTRQKEIRSIVTKVGLESKLADTYIDEDKSVDEVRTLVIEAIAEKDSKPENETRATNETRVGEDLARKGRVEGMQNALLHRFRSEDEEATLNHKTVILKGHELSEAGREYAYMSLLDMARICLNARSINANNMPKHRIADMALMSRAGLHSTSDFPEILANVLNKTLRDGYASAPITWKPFTREVFNDDFKEISRTNLGEGEKLEKVSEGGEVKHSTVAEAAEKYRIEEYARIVAITRKVIINDDLDAFTRVPERMGRRARDLESDLIYSILKDNANMADGNALFSAAHGNLSTSPAAPSEAGLTEMRKLMRRQTGLQGQEISLVPVLTVVPPEHETAMEKLLASIVPDSSTNVSPFSAAGRTPLRLDVEPRLESGSNGSLTSWFGFADKNQVDILELARLSGTNGPQTMTQEGFEVHGMKIKVMHDVGAKAIDHRGAFKNAGA